MQTDLHKLAQSELEAEKPATESDDKPAGLPVPAGPIEAMEHDRDTMAELVERHLMVFLMITTDDRAVLLEDDPTEVYQDDNKLLYFRQADLLNSFNGRAERMASWGHGHELEPGDEGLVLGVRMLRQILFELGLAEHVMKVEGRATRVWKTTRDSWRHPAGNPHLTKADMDAGRYAGDPDWILSIPSAGVWENMRTGVTRIPFVEPEQDKTPLQIRWEKANKKARLQPKDKYETWLTQRDNGAPLEELEAALNGFKALPPPGNDEQA